MSLLRQPGCIFCDIVAGDAPARVVARGHGITMFLPNHPATRGHVLLVPDEHVADVWSLPQRAARDLASEVLLVADAAREALQPDGMNIIQSNGTAATQTVAHLHVHIVPRWTNDEMGEIWPFTDPAWSPGDLDAMQADLANAVARRSRRDFT